MLPALARPSAVRRGAVGIRCCGDIAGRSGERSVPLDQFYRLPEDRPQDDTTLQHGELIVRIDVPRTAAARRSRYLKVRERASYEFALAPLGRRRART